MTQTKIRSQQRSRVVGGQPPASDLATEAVARLISETAHDLRSPLTTVREAIRIVHDGDLGPMTPDQQSYLASAMDQCDCMDQMIGEMVGWERLRTGTPRINRRWVTVAQLREMIDETLRPWALPREIQVQWDAEEPETRVFADPSMLRRLVVNLVSNAIRVTPASGSVLIRVERSRGEEMLHWSVIDHGRGIGEEELRRISQRQVSLVGGEGLGLSISRQLAALHFSNLRIGSRLGSGTEVSFQTAAVGPRSVAESYSRWRLQFCPAPTESHQGMADSNQRQLRFDRPSSSIELAHQATSPQCLDQVAAGTVSVGAVVSRQTADQFDQLLQSQCQIFDLVYRVDTRRWVWVLDADAHGVNDRVQSISRAVDAKISGARMRWSKPLMIGLDRRRTASRLSDLMIRQTLSASASRLVRSHDEVRLGTEPIVASEVAAMRLKEEMKWLTAHLGRQQAKDLRPKE